MSVARFNECIRELEEIVKGFEKEAPSARALLLRYRNARKITDALFRQHRRQDEIENPRPIYSISDLFEEGRSAPNAKDRI